MKKSAGETDCSSDKINNDDLLWSLLPFELPKRAENKCKAFLDNPPNTYSIA
jgi:hypothetical protein